MPDYIRELYLLESESDRLPFREEADHRAASLELDSCHTQIQKAMGKDFFERILISSTRQAETSSLPEDATRKPPDQNAGEDENNQEAPAPVQARSAPALVARAPAALGVRATVLLAYIVVRDGPLGHAPASVAIEVVGIEHASHQPT